MTHGKLKGLLQRLVSSSKTRWISMLALGRVDLRPYATPTKIWSPLSLTPCNSGKPQRSTRSMSRLKVLLCDRSNPPNYLNYLNPNILNNLT